MGRPDPSDRPSGRERPRVVGDGGNGRLDRILEALARPRRRHVLYCLAEEAPREIDDLAAAVARIEAGADPSEKQQESVKSALYHSVLPKLAQAHIVEYDQRSGTVCLRDPPAELEEFLVLCRELDTAQARDVQ